MIPFSLDVFTIVVLSVVFSAYSSSFLFRVLDNWDTPRNFYVRAASSAVAGVAIGLFVTSTTSGV